VTSDTEALEGSDIPNIAADP